MSLAAFQWVAHLRGVTGAQRELLLILADHHNPDTGRCDPGLATIATKTGKDRRWVRRLLHQLDGAGVLRIVAGRGRSHASAYLLPVATRVSPGPNGAAEKGVMAAPVTAPERGSNGAGKGGHLGTEKGVMVTPRNVVETRREPRGATPPPPPRSESAPPKTLDNVQGFPAPRRAPDLLWEALVAACGEPGTASERGRYNRALKELRQAGATAEDIAGRAAAARQRWRVPLTPGGLAGNWGNLGRAAPAAAAPPGRPGGGGGGPQRGIALAVQNRVLDELEAQLQAATGPRPGPVSALPGPRREVA